MAAASTPEVSLTKTDARTPAVITTPEEYRDALKRWEGHYNVLTPFSNISGLAVQHGLVVATAQINPDTSKTGPGEVYDGLPFLKGNEVALAKIGLRKLAECGGISTRTLRTDPRTIPHYWEVKATACYRGIDGAIVEREATVEWDLRDGSDRLKGWTRAQVEEGRKNGLRNCEARAINAAIREAGCGIKQKYTREELRKPFLVVRVAFQPDMSDPEQKRIVVERGLSSAAALYPSRAAAADVIDVAASPHDDEPRHIGSGSAAPAETSTAAADPDRPPVEAAVRIVDVKTKTGETKGRKWTRFLIVDSNGVEHSTFDQSIADAAIKACETKAWMEISEEQDGDYKNLVEIAPAGRQPSLLPKQEDL